MANDNGIISREKSKLNYVRGKDFGTSISSGIATYPVPGFPELMEICFFNDKTRLESEEFEEVRYSSGVAELKPTGQVSTSFERELVYSVQIRIDRLPEIIKQIQSSLDQHLQGVEKLENIKQQSSE